MTREQAIREFESELEWAKLNIYPYISKQKIEANTMAIKALEQEPVCDRLTREYISKVKCCDECFASTFCTINGLRNSCVPQDYCIENVKKYFENKASLTGAESEV